VLPKEIRFGDKDMTNVEPMHWYGGSIEETTRLDEMKVIASLQNLDMRSVSWQ
jgi:hypothetical protein